MSHFSFFYGFKETHRISNLKPLLPIIELAGDEESESLEIFLRFLEKEFGYRSIMNKVNKSELCRRCFELAEQRKISPEQIKFLTDFLSQESVKEAAGKIDTLKNSYPILLEFLEKKEQAVTVVQQFVEKFQLSKKLSYKSVIQQMFAGVYITHQVDTSGWIPANNALMLVRLLKKPEVQQWLRENVGESMPELLSDSIKGSVSKWAVIAEVDAIITLAEEKGFSHLPKLEELLLEMSWKKDDEITDDDVAYLVQREDECQEFAKLLAHEEIANLLKRGTFAKFASLYEAKLSQRVTKVGNSCVIC